MPFPISNSRISVPFLRHCKNAKERTILHIAAIYTTVHIPGKHRTHQDTPSAIQTFGKEKDLKIFQSGKEDAGLFVTLN